MPLPPKHTIELPADFMGDDDHILRIEGTFYPYVPMQGPSYASGGEPAEEASFEPDTITLVRAHIEIPITKFDLFTPPQWERIIETCVLEASECGGPDPDEAYERRREMRSAAE